MKILIKTVLSAVFSVLFPLVVVPIGWLIRLLFDPLHLARPRRSLTSDHVLPHPQPSLKDRTDEQPSTHA
ncbi:hypothetical protein GCM10023165_50020 [Variovorax defluvii]|uniref:Uncharacterized protein n=1 Tax=Variovorax defluvii TaxID=913761 RepID=A0ABP8IEC8_9BURK